MTLTVDDYRNIASFLKVYRPEADGVFDWSAMYSHSAVYNGQVVAKERPRVGKGGHVYTPTDTRKFEKAVASWAKENGFTPVFFPVKVRLMIHDQTDDPLIRLHSIAGMTYKQTGGDLDNFTKAVMDGLNKIAWQDDRQVVSVSAKRRWSSAAGFWLKVERAGMSANEYEQLKKFL